MGLIGFALYLFTVWTKPKWETADAPEAAVTAK